MTLVRVPNRSRTRFPRAWTEPDWFDSGWFDAAANRLFSNTDRSSWLPAVNVEDGEEGLTLTAELPGLAENDVHIDVEHNVLTISGEKSDERESEEEEGGRRFHLKERSYGSFRRAFTLPRTVDSEGITAEFENGVLTVHLPKAAEAKSRKIKVKAKA